jgi:ATP-dependent Clp protease ATP-binding subunit ClpB
VGVQLKGLERRLKGRGLGLVLTEAARTLLAEEGFDPAYGARPLKRVIQQRIENPLAQRILKGDFHEGDTIQVDAPSAKHDFTFEKGHNAVQGELVS